MSTWNPSDKDSAITLSSGNTIATPNAGSETGVRSTTSNSAGKYYCEFTSQASMGGAFGVGIANSSWSFTGVNGIGGDANSMAWSTTGDVYCNNVSIGTATASTTSGTVLCMAVDFATNHVWWRVNGGNWNASGTANPTTNTGGFTMTGLGAGAFFAAFGTNASTTDSALFNGGSSAFAQSAPSGFQSWDVFAAMRGTAVAKGRASGTFTQSTQVVDPWSADFWNAETSGSPGPFGPATAGLPPMASRGFTSATGRAAVTVAMPLAAKGIAQSIATTTISPTAFAVVRGTSRGTGRTAVTAARPLNSQSPGQGAGKTAINVALPLVAKGSAKGFGRSNPAYAALLASQAKSSARGAGVAATPALLRSLGRAMASGRVNASYKVFNFSTAGRSGAFGRGALLVSTALSAIGKSAAIGRAIQGAGTMVLTASSWAGKSFGRSAAMAQTAALSAAGLADGTGRGRLGGAKPIAAIGAGRAKGASGATRFAFLSTRGRSSAIGGLSLASLTAGMQTNGVAAANGRVAAAYNARLQTAGCGRTSGSNAITVNIRLNAAGSAQGSGQNGGSGTLRLGPSKSLSRGIGSATATLRAMLPSAGLGRASGRSSLTINQPMFATGQGQATGYAAGKAFGNLIARGTAIGVGTITTVGNVTVSFSGLGRAVGQGKVVFSQAAGLSARGNAKGSGRLAAFVGTASLAASGQARASAKAGNFGFAPVALMATGRALSSGVGRPTIGTALRGFGVGLSEGRCAAIASALMMASGRSRASGRSAAAAAIGFQARGAAKSSGRFYARNTLIASGRAAGYGGARISGYYNVTPDASGPRLSTLGRMPFFDSMDVGDVDFFSWDWSSRVSLLGDPIVSANVTASPSGLPVGPVVVVGDIVQVRAGAAALIETFSLRCSVVLRSGRTLHWSAPVSVQNF